MMRGQAFGALLFFFTGIPGFSAADEGRPGGKEARKPVPAMIEASEAIRATLEPAGDMNLEETLPDPVRYPDLFQEEEKNMRSFAKPMIWVEGFLIYSMPRDCSANDEEFLHKPLRDPRSLIELDEKRANEHFHPETILTWKKGRSTYRVLISLRDKTLVYCGNGASFRYGMTDEAHRQMGEFLNWSRHLCPYPLAGFDPFRESLAKRPKLEVHDGPSRAESGVETRRQEFQRGSFTIQGFTFFRLGIRRGNTDRLVELFLDQGALRTWSGLKLCGGFQPDFSISWGQGKERSHILVCLTCREVLVTGASGEFLLYDVAEDAYEKLKQELERFRPERTQVR